MLPDDDTITRSPEQHRAYLTMLAARDMANRSVAHANDLRANGAASPAEIFDQAASTFRAVERTNAAAAGISED